MMCQKDGLSLLQMCISRHNDSFVSLSYIQQRRLKIFQPANSLRYSFFDKKTHIQSHLVVPGTGSMQLAGHITYFLKQAALDTHVYILKLRLEFKFPSLNLISNGGKT